MVLIPPFTAVGTFFLPDLCPGGCYLTVDKNVGDLIDWVCESIDCCEVLYRTFIYTPHLSVQHPVLWSCVHHLPECHAGLLTATMHAETSDPSYADCNTLLNNANGSALFEIASHGVDLQKLVIGKPGAASDTGDGGFIEPTALSQCIQQAVSQRWNAGVMAYQFPHADTQWIRAVRGSAFDSNQTSSASNGTFSVYTEHCRDQNILTFY